MRKAARLSRLLVGCCAAAIALAPAATAQPEPFDPTGNRSGGPVPTINGVPCVGGGLGACLSFRQNHPPNASSEARSSFRHSPTVRR